jgi:transposase
MPSKKITFKKSPRDDSVYVYHTIRAYRNKQGKPTSDEVAIGKKDLTTGMLIPNHRYYEFFPSQVDDSSGIDSNSVTNTELDSTAWSDTNKKNSSNTLCGDSNDLSQQLTVPDKLVSCGNIYAFQEIAYQIGLLPILKKCFPEQWAQLLAISFYMICNGNVMMYIDDWFEETEVNFTKPLDDMQCSRIFRSISYGDRMKFFAEWANYRSEQEFIAYDVTSVSSYSQNLETLEFGYNRDNEKLAQLNLGMYYGATSMLPIYFNLYNGSINDKRELIFMLANTEQIGIKKIKFVLDQGFLTKDNMKYMNDKEYSYVIPLSGHLLDAISIIDNNKDSVLDFSNHIGKSCELYGISINHKIDDVPIKAHLYFDSTKQARDLQSLTNRLKKLDDELKKMEPKKKITKRFTDFFDVTENNSDNKPTDGCKSYYSYELNNDKTDKIIKRAGFFVLVTNDLKMTSCDVLEMYRKRDIIEKHFDQFKNHLDFRRFRTHSDHTTEGKAFVGFLALIIRSYIMRKTKGDENTRRLTVQKVLMELKKIKSTVSNNVRGILNCPMTKLQKIIFDVLGVPTEKFKDPC